MTVVLNKKKIFNDPIYGFVTIPDETHFDIIEHPYFQRLRRIKQVSLTTMVYPSANHTRFAHSLGAMHLMRHAIHLLRGKGYDISDEELRSASVAILLHDSGHGPFSHALENKIMRGTSHEELSLLVMQHLNEELKGHFDEAMAIFTGSHPKKFLTKLISSQLDVDRIDYLKRDSFFTGVAEGSINAERLLDMMEIVDNDLAIESKGVYSVESFIVSRRIMYWQVYMHKAVLSAEYMLLQGISSNHAYHPKKPAIKIVYKDGTVKDISEASDQLSLSVLSQPVVKHFICYPKELEL